MASKRRIRRRQCGGKRRHETAAAAEKAMRSVIFSGYRRGGWLQVYKCRFCNGYHFGHAPKKRT